MMFCNPWLSVIFHTGFLHQSKLSTLTVHIKLPKYFLQSIHLREIFSKMCKTFKSYLLYLVDNSTGYITYHKRFFIKEVKTKELYIQNSLYLKTHQGCVRSDRRQGNRMTLTF